jgi:transposase
LNVSCRVAPDTRKNLLVAETDSGGDRAAIAYSILGSCWFAGVDPQEYLADVLPRLTDRVRLKDWPALLPSRWAAAPAAASASQPCRPATPALGHGQRR